MPTAALHHRQLPVAVGVGAVDDLGQVDVAEHGGEAAGVRPGAAVRVLDDLGGLGPGGARPPGLQRGVAVGVVPDHGGPCVHQLDGLAGVALVTGEVPGQRVGVGRDGVLALVGAAVVGIGVGAALDHCARLRDAVQVRVPACHHLVEGALPGLGPRVDLGAGEVELPLGDGDSGVRERGRCGDRAGGGRAGTGQQRADERGGDGREERGAGSAVTARGSRGHVGGPSVRVCER